MAGPSPELKSNKLADRALTIARDYHAGGILNEIAWQGAYNETIELEGTPAEEPALFTRALLLSLKREKAKVNQVFDLIADRYGKGWNWHRCRGSLGLRLCQPEMVESMIAFGVPGGDIETQQDVFVHAAAAGFFVAASEYVKRLKAMKADAFLEARAGFISEVVTSGDYLRKNELKERDIADRITFALGVLIDEVDTLGNADLSTNEAGISYYFAARADIQECLRVQKLMDKALIAKFKDPMFEHLSIGVMPG